MQFIGEPSAHRGLLPESSKLRPSTHVPKILPFSFWSFDSAGAIMSCINLGRNSYNVTEGLDVKCTACLRLSAVGARCTRCKLDAERLNHRAGYFRHAPWRNSDWGMKRRRENKGAEVEEEHQLSGRVRSRHGRR